MLKHAMTRQPDSPTPSRVHVEKKQQPVDNKLDSEEIYRGISRQQLAASNKIIYLIFCFNYFRTDVPLQINLLSCDNKMWPSVK